MGNHKRRVCYFLCYAVLYYSMLCVLCVTFSVVCVTFYPFCVTFLRVCVTFLLFMLHHQTVCITSKTLIIHHHGIYAIQVRSVFHTCVPFAPHKRPARATLVWSKRIFLAFSRQQKTVSINKWRKKADNIKWSPPPHSPS